MTNTKFSFIHRRPNPSIQPGDSITFGKLYCEKKGYFDLIDQTIKLTPQFFEIDNGLYTSTVHTPGIKVFYGEDEDDIESESIYTLFGNKLEKLLDCVVIKGTEKDKKEYFSILDILEKEEDEAFERFLNSDVYKELQEEDKELFDTFPKGAGRHV